MSYRVPLKVCTPKGTRVIAKVSQVNSVLNRIDIPYFKAVEEDSPKFAIKGKIRLSYDRSNHKEIIDKVTSYLEGIFLKELADENNNTGKPIKSNKRRNKKPSNTSTTKKGRGENSDTLHHSGRGNKSSESVGGGVKDPELVKECDPDNKE